MKINFRISVFLTVVGLFPAREPLQARQMLTDIFPLAVGHKFINISYALDSNNLPVAGSEYRVVTRLAGVESIQGRNATILADSTFNADGTLKKVDTLYVAKAANGQDLDALIPLHNITQGQANDRWCTFVKPSAPINSEYTCLNLDTTGTFTIPYLGQVTGRIVATMKGVNLGQEELVVHEGRYQCTKFKTTTNAVFTPKYIPIPVTLIKNKVEVEWFADDIGPVKLSSLRYQQIGSTLSLEWINGSERQLIEKNFPPFTTLARVKLLLQGPFHSNAMDTTLKRLAYLPMTQPYSNSYWDYSGTESVTGMPRAVVDWLLVELRNGVDTTTRVATRAAFLRNDGVVIDLDGTDAVAFNIPQGPYYIAIFHRNHLESISSQAVSVHNYPATSYDFTSGSEKYLHRDACVQLQPGMWATYSGDINQDHLITTKDYLLWYGSQQDTDSGYQPGDIDCNAVIDINDYLLWSSNARKGDRGRTKTTY